MLTLVPKEIEKYAVENSQSHGKILQDLVDETSKKK